MPRIYTVGGGGQRVGGFKQWWEHSSAQLSVVWCAVAQHGDGKQCVVYHSLHDCYYYFLSLSVV